MNIDKSNISGHHTVDYMGRKMRQDGLLRYNMSHHGDIKTWESAKIHNNHGMFEYTERHSVEYNTKTGEKIITQLEDITMLARR